MGHFLKSAYLGFYSSELNSAFCGDKLSTCSLHFSTFRGSDNVSWFGICASKVFKRVDFCECGHLGSGDISKKSQNTPTFLACICLPGLELSCEPGTWRKELRLWRISPSYCQNSYYGFQVALTVKGDII